MENSEDDVTKSTASSTIGKLLAEIMGPIEEQYGLQVKGALDSLRNIMDADGIDRAPELNEFDEKVNQKLEGFFPDIKIKVHVPTPELKEVFKKGTIKVYENEHTISKDVGSMGHGAQRSIQMALIRHLADLKLSNQNLTSTTLLLIDEPELYLHPQAIEILRHSLKILSTQGYQIIFSTHSPFMITSKDIHNTLLIRKNQTFGTFRYQTLKEAVESIIFDAPHQTQTLFSLSNSSNILFSEKVILAEGKTENKLLPLLIEKLTHKSVSFHKCAFVAQTGSGDTIKSILILGAMGIPTKAIVDLDFALKEGVKNAILEENDIDLLDCKTELQRLALIDTNIFIGTDGWPAKDKTNQASYTAAKSFSILASSPNISVNINAIAVKFKASNIWVWKKGTIETHLGLEGKSESVWATFAHSLDEQGIEILLGNNYQEVAECLEWLIS